VPTALPRRNAGVPVPDGEHLRGRRADLLVYFATTAYDGPAGTDRHMTDRLGRMGPVLHVDPPVSALAFLRSGRRPHTRLRVVHRNLAVVTPWATPGLVRPGLHRLVAPLMRRAVRLALSELYPGHQRGDAVRAVVSCRLDEVWSTVPADRRVLYLTDDPEAGAELYGVPRARMRGQLSRALGGADAVAAVSPLLVEQLAGAGHHAELVPNGCDPETYADVDTARPASDAPTGHPVAGFVGFVNDRIDLALLEAVADSGTTLLVVGPVAPAYRTERFEALVARPSVCWVGPKPFEELPRYLRVMDVGLTPYADTPFNRASFPLKTLEYLAAGRPVVSTPLPANDWLATDLIEVAAGPEEFAERVRAAGSSPRTAEVLARRRAFAAEHSWAGRAAQLAALAGVTDERRPTCPR
jgi:teichuronic acid biosynthesis glycosyltransferase TuaH